ncbi:M6 metalloprotease [Delitschia confertaspora ATCC 74209]|uniref:M6 metalloprotease n=1 Tax=Delitschia confertaspora ATCC 74209 TaxID=1513339 RepID=A0A9P4JLQ3_9PLEO|nr:M6 metalloprotease [Delitschia confertaspora ATCC 74209]
MAPRHSDHPCFVAPNPDALARLKTETFKVQGTGHESSFKSRNRKVILGDRSGTIPGLNDGLIFPNNHFDGPVSVSHMTKAALERAPLRGSLKIAIVLVEFQDVKMAAGAIERFQDLFFSTGKIPTGSVTEYYSEVSRGHISFTGEVVGPFTLSHDMGHYANGNFGRGWPEPNSQTMAAEALEAARGKLNFKPYDNDGNGYVDAFVVVHAGTGAETTLNTSDIWSVKWVLPEEKTVDGVNIYGFLTIPEDAKIGVSAHEIGHLVFGWPDLYDIDNTSWGIGNWCLMSYGSWGGGGDRPVHPSAWCKANQGWIDVVNETENHQNISLRDVKSEYKAHRLWKDGDASSSEYFLVENRQLTGYDESLPGAGLLVWHIDDGVYGNSDENHPMVGLVQADGLAELASRISDAGDAGDVFPGVANNTTFNSISNPNSKSYSGAETYVSITNITAASEYMTFDITVKATDPPLEPFDSKTWYQLKNTFAGHSLDVINDGAGNKEGLITMAREGNFSGQCWQIIPNGHGTYALRTLYLGPNRQLDVYGDDKTKPHLAEAGPYSGQIWKIGAWGDGTWHLENLYSGPYLYLDTMEGGPRVAMNQSNIGRPTQRWTITPVRKITEPGF